MADADDVEEKSRVKRFSSAGICFSSSEEENGRGEKTQSDQNRRREERDDWRGKGSRRYSPGPHYSVINHKACSARPNVGTRQRSRPSVSCHGRQRPNHGLGKRGDEEEEEQVGLEREGAHFISWLALGLFRFHARLHPEIRTTASRLSHSDCELFVLPPFVGRSNREATVY